MDEKIALILTGIAGFIVVFIDWLVNLRGKV